MDRQTLGSTSTGEITGLLAAARQGDGEATHRLMALVYDELRVMARRQLRSWRQGQTINTTVLVHEAYLKLVDHDSATWEDRSLGAVTIKEESAPDRQTATLTDDVVLYDISFPDAQHGFIAGEFGTILVTRMAAWADTVRKVLA